MKGCRPSETTVYLNGWGRVVLAAHEINDRDDLVRSRGVLEAGAVENAKERRRGVIDHRPQTTTVHGFTSLHLTETASPACTRMPRLFRRAASLLLACWVVRSPPRRGMIKRFGGCLQTGGKSSQAQPLIDTRGCVWRATGNEQFNGPFYRPVNFKAASIHSCQACPAT